MMEIINFCKDNYAAGLEILGAVYLIASIIASVTPSDKDDSFIAKVGAFFDRIGIKLKGK